MPKLNMTEAHRLALTGALALAVGAGLSGGDSKPDKQSANEAAQDIKLDPALVVDAKKYHAAIKPARDACGPNCTDLLSGPCEPGKACVTGVSLPKGATLSDVELVGAGSFGSPSWTCEDRDEQAWCEVTATNTGSKPARLTALVEYATP
jgi:hypothetical protein